ncbi:MAG: hypothetical protein ACE5GX_12820 [Thermoanaerobaculia bacterium]
MAGLHNWIGWLMVVVFLATGQYMRYVHDPPVAQLDSGLRMLFRSRHIYLLLVGLLNLMVGLKGAIGGPVWLQRLAAGLLIASCALVLAAFAVETSLLRAPTPLSIYGIQAAFAGAVCYLVANRLAVTS